MNMKFIKSFGLIISVFSLFILLSMPFQSCKPDDEEKEDDGICDSCVVVYKPNIYIYPLEQTELNITLYFPKGGNIITSIPEYQNGWRISVEPDGWINDSFYYLFYESRQPDVWQQNEGWMVEKNQLENFFVENLTEYGFAGREIQDFIDYWIPRLNNSEYYIIYPQTQEVIKTVIELDCSAEPDNLMRLFYLIQESYASKRVIPEPQIDHTFERSGFFITEWGVVLK